MGIHTEKTNQNTPRILILRFSSFGDILQCLSVPALLKQKWPHAEIHWATRENFRPLIESHPDVNKVWSLDFIGSENLQKSSFEQKKRLSLWQLSKILHKENFTHIYDAHRSLRSSVICLSLFFLSLMTFKLPRFSIVRKSQKRWKRFLLFRFRINQFEMPFSGQRDLLEPLQKWGIQKSLPSPPQFFFPHDFKAPEVHLPDQFIALAPSAAHSLKRWPLEYWNNLIQSFPEEFFVVLGGPEDDFLKDLEKYPKVKNLAGKISMIESAWVISKSQLLISNDTGPMHFGEQLGHPTIALMGPAPFGFPSRKTTRVLEMDLSCRPCSKHGQGPCKNPEFQKCLRDIKPEIVQKAALELIENSRTNR